VCQVSDETPDLDELRAQVEKLEESVGLVGQRIMQAVFIAANRVDLTDEQRAALLAEINAVVEEQIPGIAQRLRAANLPDMMKQD
jgi:hypothetical protein